MFVGMKKPMKNHISILAAIGAGILTSAGEEARSLQDMATATA